ncbi:hypothetical protein [Macrococcus armenti]|uniref:hypothetical protein n=1 Tax=Macrococcus armenti TaxID=2875764 RepID=UPI001CCFF698|nr:hypothetical protein [Macrococcus armenti]UBH14892.1 hypothetical protein LAU44_08990 [Macrococcus armenti]UBH17252.1 hypothetical protein LAU39_09020 [Macrococcus armenti]UBH19517.1 hypothetical protein LAU40_09000 [Macrococcus armenti]
MNYKLLTCTLLASSLVLAACGNSEENKDEKSEVKKEKTSTEKATTEKPTTEKPTTEKPTTEAPTSENSTTEAPTAEPTTTEAPVTANINNVTSRSQLEGILYNNSISEIDKIAAYNSAVRNGVIPQGNVMEGPAIAAYESSLRVESGAEKSVYEADNSEANNNTEDVDAWRNNVQGGLSSGEIQMKHLIENGMYNEPDAKEIYQKILEKERQYGN